MTLKDALSQQKTVKGPKCSVNQLLQRLDKDDANALVEALNGGVPLSHIARALKQEGHPVGDHSLSRHKRGECQCP